MQDLQNYSCLFRIQVYGILLVCVEREQTEFLVLFVLEMCTELRN